VVCGVFTQEVDGVGDKESRDTTTVDTHTVLEAFLNMSLGSAGFTEEAFFLVKNKISLNKNNFAVYSIAAHNTNSNIHLVFTGKIHTKICYLSLSLFISYNRHFC
jgi:hypothetical protein